MQAWLVRAALGCRARILNRRSRHEPDAQVRIAPIRTPTSTGALYSGDLGAGAARLDVAAAVRAPLSVDGGEHERERRGASEEQAQQARIVFAEE